MNRTRPGLPTLSRWQTGLLVGWTLFVLVAVVLLLRTEPPATAVEVQGQGLRASLGELHRVLLPFYGWLLFAPYVFLVCRWFTIGVGRARRVLPVLALVGLVFVTLSTWLHSRVQTREPLVVISEDDSALADELEIRISAIVEEVFKDFAASEFEGKSMKVAYFESATNSISDFVGLEGMDGLGILAGLEGPVELEDLDEWKELLESKEFEAIGKFDGFREWNVESVLVVSNPVPGISRDPGISGPQGIKWVPEHMWHDIANRTNRTNRTVQMSLPLDGQPALSQEEADLADSSFDRAVIPIHLMGFLFLLGLFHARAHYRLGQDRRQSNEQLKRELVEARLAHLQTQLQPHFLFNTLNGISGQIDTNPDGAIDMIAALGQVLRDALETSDQATLLPLSRELEVLENYLEIQSMRFPERLAIHLDIDPRALPALVPGFLLQPLVENVVQHAVEPSVKVCHLHILARVNEAGDRLQLDVRDDGPGFDPHSPPKGTGTGLRNLRERLTTLYPDTHRIEQINLSDEGGQGTLIRIDLPCTA